MVNGWWGKWMRDGEEWEGVDESGGKWMKRKVEERG